MPEPRDERQEEPEEKPSVAPRRGRRLLFRLTGLAAALWLLYLAGGNFFLRSPELQRRLFEHPEKLRVTWERAWTLWPGRVHLEAVEIRGQNRKLQWWARLDRTAVSVDLPRLLFRTFHARRISGGGVVFHLRPRLSEGETAPRGPDGTALTPDIPGFDNPPDPPPEPPGTTGREERPPGWKIHLEGIDLGELRELWVDRYRLTGGGRVAGALELQVRGALAVDAARLVVEQGKLTEGAGELLERLDLDLDLALDVFEPREETGLDFLRFLSGRLRIETRTASLDFLDPWLTRVPGLDLDGGGALTAEVGLDHGRPTPGSRLELVPEGLDVEYQQFRATGSGRLDAEITANRRTRLAASFERFELRIQRAAEAAADRRHTAVTRLAGSGLTLTAEAGELRLDQVPPPPTVEIRLAELEIPEVTAFNDLLPEDVGLRLTGGRGAFAAQATLDAATGSGRGEVTLTVSDLAARVEPSESLRIDALGGLRVRVRVPRFDLVERTLETAGGEVGLRDFALTGSAGELRWQAALDRLDLELDPEAFRRRTVHAPRIVGRGFTLAVDRPEGPAAGAAQRPRRRSTASREGWHLLLDHLDLSEIREARWNQVLLRGDSRLEGTIAWRLGGTFSAPRLRLEVDDGKLLERKPRGDPSILLPRLAVRADLECEELLPGLAGTSLPAHLSGTLHVETRSERLTLLNRFLSRIPELSLDGRGDLSLDLILHRGNLEPGTRLTGVGDLEVRLLDYQARGAGHLAGAIERVGRKGRSADGSQTVLHADFDRFDLSWRDGPQHYVRGRDLAIEITGPGLYLGGPIEKPHLQIAIDMPDSEVPDVTVYNSMLPAGAGLRLTSGRGALAAHARYDTETAVGSADLTLRAAALSARYGTTDLTGDFQLTTRIPRLRLAERTFDLDHTRLDIRRAVVAGEPMETGWWMVVELPESRLDLGLQPRLEARIQASMRDSSPLTAYLESRRKILRWIDDALTLEDVEMEADLDARPGLYRLRDAKITGRHLEILGELRLGESENAGLFLLQTGPLSVGFEMVGGRKDLNLLHSQRWFEERKRLW